MLTLGPGDTAVNSQVIESIWWGVPREHRTTFDADALGMCCMVPCL